MAMRPSKLGVQPIVDAVFEAWVTPTQFPLPSVVPGLLLTHYRGSGVTMERLPTADIPPAFREAREELKHQPVMRINWGNYIVNIGEYSIGVGCKMPYPGWSEFKKAIVSIFKLIIESNFIQSVERHSMKYVDLLREDYMPSLGSGLNININVGNKVVSEQVYTFKTEFHSDGMSEVLTIISKAVAHVANMGPQTGAIVDIDTISTEGIVEPVSFLTGLEDRIEKLHAANKELFFSCLTEEQIARMEPSYA